MPVNAIEKGIICSYVHVKAVHDFLFGNQYDHSRFEVCFFQYSCRKEGLTRQFWFPLRMDESVFSPHLAQSSITIVACSAVKTEFPSPQIASAMPREL